MKTFFIVVQKLANLTELSTVLNENTLKTLPTDISLTQRSTQQESSPDHHFCRQISTASGLQTPLYRALWIALHLLQGGSKRFWL